MAQNLLGCSAEQHGRSMSTGNTARNTHYSVLLSYNVLRSSLVHRNLLGISWSFWFDVFFTSLLLCQACLKQSPRWFTPHIPDPLFPHDTAAINEGMACNHSGSNSMYRVQVDGRKHNLFHICLHKAWAGLWFNYRVLATLMYTIIVMALWSIKYIETWIQNGNASIHGRKLSDRRMTREGQNTNQSVAPKKRKNLAKRKMYRYV